MAGIDRYGLAIGPLMLVSTLLLAGCAPTTTESVTKRYIAVIEKFADRLDKIQSPEDADRAVADLQKLVKQSDEIFRSARKIKSQREPSEVTKKQAEAAAVHLKASLQRVKEAGAMTNSLAAVIERMGTSASSIARSMAVGAMPTAESSLDQAYIDWITTFDEEADLLNTIINMEQAQKAKGPMVEILVRRHAALQRIAALGGKEPPFDLPPKFSGQYHAASRRTPSLGLTRVLGVEEALGWDSEVASEKRKRIAANPDPFHKQRMEELNANLAPPQATASSSARNTAVATITNGKKLSEQQRQQVTELLKQVSGAKEARWVANSDGICRVELSPVEEIGPFFTKIRIGFVSNVDFVNQTFDLDVNSTQLSLEAKKASHEAPAGMLGNTPIQTYGVERINKFTMQHGGMENCAILVLESASRIATAEDNALIKHMARLAGAKKFDRLRPGPDILLLAPIEDFEGFAAKIDVGTVTKIDSATREIHITVDLSKLSP